MDEENMEIQPCVSSQLLPMSPEPCNDSLLLTSPASPEGNMSDTTYKHLLKYIEARQQTLMVNIGCCEYISQRLKELSSVYESLSDEDAENVNQENHQKCEDPMQDSSSQSDVNPTMKTEPGSDLRLI